MSSFRLDSTGAAQLQEAVDVILQQFDHPSSISITYEYVDGRRHTTLEVATADGTVAYELVYDGSRDDAEPGLDRVE